MAQLILKMNGGNRQMKSLLNRRAFLRNTALGGTGLLILQNSGSARSYQANDKLNIALIGVGGRRQVVCGSNSEI